MNKIEFKEDVITNLFNGDYNLYCNCDFYLEECGCSLNNEVENLGNELNSIFEEINELNSSFSGVGNIIVEEYIEFDEKTKKDIENG